MNVTGKYFVEDGALQMRMADGPQRLIECYGDAKKDAKKISEVFARRIAEALNTLDAFEMSPKIREAQSLRAMQLMSPEARMFQEAMAIDLEEAAIKEWSCNLEGKKERHLP